MGKSSQVKDKQSAAKKAAQEAAQQQAPKVENPSEQEEIPAMAKILEMGKSGGLSGDSKVLLASLVQKRYIDNPESPDSVKDGANIVADALIGDVIVTNIVKGNEMFAMIIRRDEKRYLAVRSMLASQGITLPEFKALPAPTEEQLKAAGVALLPAESAVVTVKAEDVSEEAKKKKKAEKAIEDSNPTTNPAEIKNEKQLAASLSNLLTKSSDNIDARIQRVIDFYRGYLTIQANHAEKKEEELEKVKNMSRSQMLSEIATVVGPCPFALDGHGKLFRNHLVRTNTPIASFCLYRRSTKENSKNPIDDSFVADIVKILIIWSCNSAIADAKKTIAECERLVKKNEKIVAESQDKNEVAIAKSAVKTWKEQANKPVAIIDQMNATLELISNPSLDAVDSLIEDYNGKDDTKEEYKRAHLIVDNVIKTFYKGIDLTKVDNNVLLQNVQQRAGIIINMFRDPLAQSIAYSESNLTTIETKEAPAEEAPAEEEAKN